MSKDDRIKILEKQVKNLQECAVVLCQACGIYGRIRNSDLAGRDSLRFLWGDKVDWIANPNDIDAGIQDKMGLLLDHLGLEIIKNKSAYSIVKKKDKQ
jgi:hypothetical protein